MWLTQRGPNRPQPLPDARGVVCASSVHRQKCDIIPYYRTLNGIEGHRTALSLHRMAGGIIFDVAHHRRSLSSAHVVASLSLGETARPATAGPSAAKSSYLVSAFSLANPIRPTGIAANVCRFTSSSSSS